MTLNTGGATSSNATDQSSTERGIPFREGPLKELLRNRASKERAELLRQLDIMFQVSVQFQKPVRFSFLASLIETEIFDEDQDYELATQLLAHFSFTDKQAIEFGLRVLRHD